jgi:hypothetical protein
MNAIGAPCTPYLDRFLLADLDFDRLPLNNWSLFLAAIEKGPRLEALSFIVSIAD